MTENRTEGPDVGADRKDSDARFSGAFDFAQELGTALINIDLYGFEHRLTVTCIEKCYGRLGQVLAQSGRLDFAVSDNADLILNGTQVARSGTRLLALARRLQSLRISGLTLKEGMAPDEFVQLVAYLARTRTAAADAAQAADATAAKIDLPHVMTTRLVVTQVSDDETAKPDAAAEGAAVEQIIAFLQGQVGTDDAAAAAQVVRAASDAQKLASLILDASAMRQSAAAPAGGESLGDIVVGCLRRTFLALSQGPSARSQKGKKELKRTLAVLEENVLEKLRGFAKEGYEQAAGQVREEVEGMQEELEVDDLVTRYSRGRRLADETEKKLLRFMRRTGAGDPEFRAKLEAEGVGQQQWERLVIQSGAGAREAPIGDATLSVLLAELSQAMAQLASEEQTAKVLGRVAEGVDRAVALTHQKIDDLAAVRDGRKPGKTNADFFTMLREIVQELCQPLSVVNATIQMLADNRLGQTSAVQHRALALAVESAERLQHLIQRLVQVTGVPAGFDPDAAVIDRIYKE